MKRIAKIAKYTKTAIFTIKSTKFINGVPGKALRNLQELRKSSLAVSLCHGHCNKCKFCKIRWSAFELQISAKNQKFCNELLKNRGVSEKSCKIRRPALAGPLACKFCHDVPKHR